MTNGTNNTQNQGGDSGRLDNLEARTMASDAQSIQNQGGGEPKPYTPKEPASVPMQPEQVKPAGVPNAPGVAPAPKMDTSGAFKPPQVEPITPGKDMSAKPAKAPGAPGQIPPKVS